MDWHGDWVRDGMWLLWIALAVVVVYTIVARRGERRKKKNGQGSAPHEDPR